MIGRLRSAWDALRGAETRATVPGAALWTGGGRVVNARVAENLSTIAAAVGVVASALSSLPCFVYRTAGEGREIDEAHPLARLIEDGPNDHQSWADWIEFTAAQVLLRGNALSEIVRDGAGNVVALEPVPWENVSVIMLSSGRLAYDVVRIHDMWGGTGRPRRLLEGDAFHLKDRSDDGLVGRSRLSRSPAVVDTALSVQEFAGSMYRNGATPRGLLSIKGKLNDDTTTRLQTQWQQMFVGPSNAARTLILDQEGSFSPISVSPEDAELLASRKFTTEELCRIYGVPPPLIQDYSHNTFTNSHQASLWFSMFCLAPWARKFEAEVKRSIFVADERSTYHVELDLSAMTRGDFEARWNSYRIARDVGILTTNEIRTTEGWNPVDGGDELMPPKAPAPAGGDSED
jgi:HK97 family phage portal protein